MSTDQEPTPLTKDQLEAEIQDLRRSVGDTVEVLTYRLDVKARAKDRVRAIPPYVAAGAAAAVVGGIGLWLWRRRDG